MFSSIGNGYNKYNNRPYIIKDNFSKQINKVKKKFLHAHKVDMNFETNIWGGSNIPTMKLKLYIEKTFSENIFGMMTI